MNEKEQEINRDQQRPFVRGGVRMVPPEGWGMIDLVITKPTHDEPECIIEQTSVDAVE